MAIEQQDDQNNQQAPAPSTGGGGESAPAPSGNNNAAVGTINSFNKNNQASKQGSGRYNNLQKYITANQGAGERLAQGIGGQLERTAQPAQKEQQTQASNIREGIAAAQGTLQQGQGYVQQAQATPQDIINQGKLEDFTNFRTGNAVDINNLNQQKETLQNLNNQALASAQQRQAQVGSETGRYGLLKETFGGRNVPKAYSTGQQRLDQLFLQAGAGDQNKNLQNIVQGQIGNINQLGKQATELGTNIGDVNTQSQNLSQNLNDVLRYGASKEDIGSELNQRGYEDIQKDLEARLANVQTSAPAELEAIRGRLEQNALTPEDMQKLGLNSYLQSINGAEKDKAADPLHLYNVNLSDYVSGSANNPSLAGIANQDEFSRFNTLRQLAGGDTATADIFGGATDVGGYKPYEYDTKRLNDALTNASNEYKNAGQNEVFSTHTAQPQGTNAFEWNNIRKYYGISDYMSPQASQQKIAELKGQLGSVQGPQVPILQNLIQSLQQGVQDYNNKYQSGRTLGAPGTSLK